MTERRQVHTGKDTILTRANSADPVDAVAELIWNGIDAEATEVNVVLSIRELGAVDEIAVRDNGHGLSYADATDVFVIDGESWKKEQRFSHNMNRPLHGQHGRGRFLVYRLAEKAEWDSVWEDDGQGQRTRIFGTRAVPNEFTFDGPEATAMTSGTAIRLICEAGNANGLADVAFPDKLRARLAPSLRALTDVVVSYDGSVLDPDEGIVDEHVVELQPDPASLHGLDAPKLVVIEWSHSTRYRKLLLCDDSGAVVTETSGERVAAAPFNWTAYLLWPGFRDPSLMTSVDLHVPEVRHRSLIDAAWSALRRFFADEVDRRRGALVEEWKREGSYPYVRQPVNPTEVVEQHLFDVVAVVASPSLGRSTKERRLSLGLLRESVIAHSSRTREILGAVLDLSDHEKDVLTELLDRTTLGSMVRAAHTVAGRLDFIHGLQGLLYSDKTRQVFREVDQLQPMVSKEPWVFGDEWTDTLTESGLTRLVKTALERQNPDIVYAPTPLKLEDGRRGRVDIALYRQLPESEGSRHLVVELKRANVKITMTEYSQVSNYAAAITESAEVATDRHQWDFWLVGTECDTAVRNQLLRDPASPGLALKADRFRIWVITWSELLDRAQRRLESFAQQLQLVSTEEAGQAYLERIYPQFIPPMPRAIGEEKGSSQ